MEIYVKEKLRNGCGEINGEVTKKYEVVRGEINEEISEKYELSRKVYGQPAICGQKKNHNTSRLW